MTSPRYTIVEPHPSVATTRSYIATGRGGAGNQVNISPSKITRGSDASGPASRASLSSISQSRRSFITGRGGMGNHSRDAPRMFSFDEELQQQMAKEKSMAPVYHVGRGGAGNYRASTRDREESSNGLSRQMSRDTASSASSAGSESGADIATRNLKKGLKKLAGVF